MNKYLTKMEILSRFDEKKWREVEAERKQKAEKLALLDKNEQPLWFVLDQNLLGLISEIEQFKGFLASLKLSGTLQKQRAHRNLLKEAYFSSRIEGARTSLEEALLNLESKKKIFSDESMQMIYNNKLALEFMIKQKASKITHKMICELQKLLVYNTHKDKPITVGEYRKGPIYVVNGLGQVVYEGPKADKVKKMMSDFITWLNGESSLHPLIKAGIAHYYFVHIHPFDDGNGRSARALSNLVLDQHNYKFINLLSPSDYFEHHKSDYYRSIQNVEKHDADATYFILYYLTALLAQLKIIKSELEKQKKVSNIEDILKKNVLIKLNKRQIKSLKFLVQQNEALTNKKYCKLNKCSDETARIDLKNLVDLKVLFMTGEGRSTKYELKQK